MFIGVVFLVIIGSRYNVGGEGIGKPKSVGIEEIFLDKALRPFKLHDHSS